MLTLNIFSENWAKRIFDTLLAAASLFVFLPVFLLFILLVILEDGLPVFFAKESVGLSGKTFRQIKFRSMVNNAELRTGPVWARKDDPRVTKVGRFLRMTAMDELPQLFNIFKGDMSFVGPRPQRRVLVDKYLKEIPGYGERFKVRPGLTGPAQVLLPYDASVSDKLKLDILYAGKHNLPGDIALVIRSFMVTFRCGWGKCA